jgi:hypothetical protein
LYNILKLLLSLGRSTRDPFIEFSRISKFLIDISRNLRLVESSGIFSYKVDISRSFKLVDLSRFSRF